MSFNIEWGGARISFDNVVEAIKVSNADIVGIQEAEGNLQRLAGELGWYFDLRNYVISRFPVIEPPGSEGKYAYVEVEPGRIVAIANIHLPSDPYGPDALRDGASPAEVLHIGNAARMPELNKYIGPLVQLVTNGVPVFIVGDFNSPAHTDWTESAVGSRKFLDYSIDWPVSLALTQAGFSDSWRVVYPDPVRHPGLTWLAGRPPLEDYAPSKNDPQDRIDFIWFAGAVEAKSSQLAGEINGPEVSFGLTPWPSDHRAVVSGFRVVPVELPELVTTGNRVYREDAVIDIHSNSANDTVLYVVEADKLEIVAKRQVPGGRADWFLDAAVPGPGHYRVRMQHAPSNTSPGREFWVLPRDAVSAVEVTASSFQTGEAISVRWRNAPGNRNDYLAAYPQGVETNYDNGLAWVYIRAVPEGELWIDESTTAWGWPLAPGDYVIRLVRDDGFEVLAESAPFSVR
jgi:endonuclease/exonuclease/phosphatase family metal-dependent hydrolase